MSDQVVAVGKSTVQHGPANNRVYLMQLSSTDLPGMPGRLVGLAEHHGYTKVIARVPERALSDFLQAEYHVEARIPGLYGGLETGFFVARFLDAGRAAAEPSAVVDSRLLFEGLSGRGSDHPRGFSIRGARPEDAAAIARVYAKTFTTYPFPIENPDYLRKEMAGDVRFFVVLRGETIVAASSAEMDRAGENAEMTDFAVLPECRGLRLSEALLLAMEGAMLEQGIKTAYTICRAGWYPVNRLFAGAGYLYGGTLVRNTQICGRCESMHVWHRFLQ